MLSSPTAVKEAFNQIAGSWYNVRHWPLLRGELEETAQRWQKGRLLNIGCAHGPDFLIFRDSFELWGLDISEAMIGMGRRYSSKFSFDTRLTVGDACFLPYRDSSFDCAIAVATYHHIKGAENRGQAFGELRRVLKPQGEAFLSVWNRWQRRFWFKPKDVAIPWKTGEGTVYRYYYLFSYHEMEKTLQRAGFEIIKAFPENSYKLPIKKFSRNICVLVRKR